MSIPTPAGARSVAQSLHDVLSLAFAGEPPLRVRGWDGSEVGPVGAPVVVVRRPRALRWLLWAPGELGLARAYVSGDLDIEGNLADGLRRVWAAAREKDLRPTLSPRLVATTVRTLLRLKAIGPAPVPPAAEARTPGRLHSKSRDARAISHHYDLSNALYELLLDEHMAYSCAYWTRTGDGYGLADAQRDKLDLICRKLDLRPGSRLLDVGCGWGALAVHAAQHYGAHVTGITLSAEQLAFGSHRVARDGLVDQVELRLQDYRDLPASASYDAVTAIEMGEHVGARNYPTFLTQLRGALRPEGRLLIQQMSHGPRHPGGGPFIERYIAPDMHMRPLPETLALVHDAGFEIRHVHALREHYVRTVEAWRAEFEAWWDEVVDLVGEEQARVWRLHLVGGALAFEQNRMGVDQILAVNVTADGRASMPPTRADWETPAGRADEVLV
jgi:cyclopropane-fatty-acyl-phospholipid synthase